MPVISVDNWTVEKELNEEKPTFGTLTFTFWSDTAIPKMTTGKFTEELIEGEYKDYKKKSYEHRITTKKALHSTQFDGWTVSLYGDKNIYYTICFSTGRQAITEQVVETIIENEDGTSITKKSKVKKPLYTKEELMALLA